MNEAEVKWISTDSSWEQIGNGGTDPAGILSAVVGILDFILSQLFILLEEWHLTCLNKSLCLLVGNKLKGARVGKFLEHVENLSYGFTVFGHSTKGSYSWKDDSEFCSGATIVFVSWLFVFTESVSLFICLCWLNLQLRNFLCPLRFYSLEFYL